jgi:hypothetical protein
MTLTLAAPAQADTTAVPTEGAEQVIQFSALDLTAQVGLLEAHCTTLSNERVVFTCEDELQYASELSAPLEIVYDLVDLANLVLDNSATADGLADAVVDDMLDGTLELASGPALQNYIASVNAFVEPSDEQVTMEELATLAAGPVTVQATVPAMSSGRMSFALFGIRGVIAKYKCGFFGNDRPRRAAKRFTELNVKSPESYLRSLGYHKTPNRLFGGGWTRPQTYLPFYCGISTFRDHSNIVFCGTHNFGDGTGTHRVCDISRQEYSAAPYGEPNPEVYRSGPWPYAVWPAYVFLWHRSH